MIRRRGQEHEEEASSSDEEDAFAALSRKTKTKRTRVESNANPPIQGKKEIPGNVMEASDRSSTCAQNSVHSTSTMTTGHDTSKHPVSLSSSLKRHHNPNDTRKAKMDALLLELETEKGKRKNNDPRRFVPEKIGSFVSPGEEKVTSNLFVGNLAPSITEEDLSTLFSQFGELYSLKIMWPRTVEERQRGRNTGFICFVNRQDAEEALESCNDTDPFNVGRLLTMGWGKNVKKNIRRGAEDFGESQLLSRSSGRNDLHNQRLSDPKARERGGDRLRPDGLPKTNALGSPRRDRSIPDPFDESLHSSGCIRVEAPKEPDRFDFISKVATYVAKDGSDVEMRLCNEERGNPLFNFLTLEDADEQQRQDHLFYRWRVYSFCQGDTFSTWRTDPFVMFYPNGRYWIPPPQIQQEADRERAFLQDGQRGRKRGLRPRDGAREMATGRQIERARMFWRRGRGQHRENPSVLDANERREFDRLVREDLTLSRDRICRAMAFCFDKCLAAKQISGLLKDALLEETTAVTIDLRIARLFLLSDVLFNSQQPGIRNAFMYRTTIESMAPEIFSGLGKYRAQNFGRMTINKLRKAVSAVLGAWTEWGVYNAAFMDELGAHFEGKEHSGVTEDENSKRVWQGMDEVAQKEGQMLATNVMSVNIKSENQTLTKPFDGNECKGNEEANKIEGTALSHQDNIGVSHSRFFGMSTVGQDGEPIGTNMDDPDGGDIDGEDIGSEDIDGEDIDGEDIDGEDIDGEDLDGDLDDEDSEGQDFADQPIDSGNLNVFREIQDEKTSNAETIESTATE